MWRKAIRPTAGKRTDQAAKRRRVSRPESQADQHVLKPGQHGIRDNQLHRPRGAPSGLDSFHNGGVGGAGAYSVFTDSVFADGQHEANPDVQIHA